MPVGDPPAKRLTVTLLASSPDPAGTATVPVTAPSWNWNVAGEGDVDPSGQTVNLVPVCAGWLGALAVRVYTSGMTWLKAAAEEATDTDCVAPRPGTSCEPVPHAWTAPAGVTGVSVTVAPVRLDDDPSVEVIATETLTRSGASERLTMVFGSVVWNAWGCTLKVYPGRVAPRM